MRRFVIFVCLLLLASCGETGPEVVETPDTGVLSPYVDLGLSVMWATCNLGADTPYELGDLYAWGETQTKDEYTVDNYKFYPTRNTYIVSKYSGDSISDGQKSDHKFKLDPEDDAATISLGTARIPSAEDWAELYAKCSMEAYSNGGKYFVRIISNVMGYERNQIIIPLEYIDADRMQISLWSSTLSPFDKFRAISQGFSFAINCSSMKFEERFKGLHIRPVYPKAQQ